MCVNKNVSWNGWEILKTGDATWTMFISFGVIGRIPAVYGPKQGDLQLFLDPKWAYGGSIPCSRVHQWCSECVLTSSPVTRMPPGFVHAWTWTNNPPLLSPVPLQTADIPSRVSLSCIYVGTPSSICMELLNLFSQEMEQILVAMWLMPVLHKLSELLYFFLLATWHVILPVHILQQYGNHSLPGV